MVPKFVKLAGIRGTAQVIGKTVVAVFEFSDADYAEQALQRVSDGTEVRR